jgi:hypothetical protein
MLEFFYHTTQHNFSQATLTALSSKRPSAATPLARTQTNLAVDARYRPEQLPSTHAIALSSFLEQKRCTVRETLPAGGGCSLRVPRQPPFSRWGSARPSGPFHSLPHSQTLARHTTSPHFPHSSAAKVRCLPFHPNPTFSTAHYTNLLLRRIRTMQFTPFTASQNSQTLAVLRAALNPKITHMVTTKSRLNSRAKNRLVTQSRTGI